MFGEPTLHIISYRLAIFSMILANIINKESNQSTGNENKEFIIFGNDKQQQEQILKWFIWVSLLMIGNALIIH